MDDTSRCPCSVPAKGVRRHASERSSRSRRRCRNHESSASSPTCRRSMLHADAALNAMEDAGLKPPTSTASPPRAMMPQQIAHYLGITPTWVDGTSVGGCSFMLHVRHAAAAIEAGLCKTVLITHGESGKSRVIGRLAAPDPRTAQRPVRSCLRPDGTAEHLPHPVLRYMKTYGVTHEQLAWSPSCSANGRRRIRARRSRTRSRSMTC
jgi:hypothetical protein